MIPAIKKSILKKTPLAAALERHLNSSTLTHASNHVTLFALEEERANGTEIDDAAIQGVKIGMMGTSAGNGDPVFWFTVRPILKALVHHSRQTGIV